MREVIPPTAVMGFGNPVRSDDGIGIEVIRQLREKYTGQDIPVTFFDMGASAFEVLFQLKGHQRIFMIDAVVNSGDPAGTLYQVPADKIARAPEEDPLVFLHGMKWDQCLSYAHKILGADYPDDIQVFLIAVDDTRLAEGLSPVVKEAGEQVIGHIEKALWKQFA